MNEILKSSAFRLAIVFALVVTISTCVVFAIVYSHISTAEVRRLREILSMRWRMRRMPMAQVQHELDLRLTRDLRRIEYVGLYDATGKLIYGNVSEGFDIPIDGSAHDRNACP